MKVSIVNCVKRDDAQYFSIMVEGAEGSECAMLLDGWKYREGKILAPSMIWKGNSYGTVLVSPKLAEDIGKALAAAGFEDDEFDAHSWTSAKWGQHGLKRLCATEEVALSYWQKYRR